VQVLLAGAAYTANLTSFFVHDSRFVSIKSIKDAISLQAKVCVLRNRIIILDNSFGKDKINYAINPKDGLPGFNDRPELFPAMDNGLCDCAIAGEAEIAVSYSTGDDCDKIITGKPVIELAWGLPVSDKYAAPLNTAATTIMQDGVWKSITDTAKPESICPEEAIDSDTISLRPEQMLGSYVLSGCLAVLGILISLGSLVKKRHPYFCGAPPDSKRTGRSLSVESFVHSMKNRPPIDYPARAAAIEKSQRREKTIIPSDAEASEETEQTPRPPSDRGGEADRDAGCNGNSFVAERIECGGNSRSSNLDIEQYRLHSAMKRLRVEMADLKATMMEAKSDIKKNT